MRSPSAGLSGEPLRVYRTTPARVLGWVLVAGAALLTVLTVVDVVSDRDTRVLAPVALVVGVAGGAWVLFLRPRVLLHADGVHLVNVVTETTLPFAAVDDVTHQWALELHDVHGRRHSAWAVPVRREMVRRRPIDDFAETTRHRGSEGVTAQGAADEVLRTMQRWRLDGGERPDAPAEVRQVVSWPAVVVLGLAVALAVLAVLS